MEVIKLSEVDKNKYESSIQRHVSPYDSYKYFRLLAKRSVLSLSEDVLLKIHDFAFEPEAPGFLFLENLPVVEDLPDTPVDGLNVKNKSSFTEESILIGLSSLIGQSIGFSTEKQGELIHSVAPVEARSKSQSNEGSGTFLRFHNDTVYSKSGYFNDDNPDFLILVGLRSQPGKNIYTSAIDARDIIKEMTSQEVEELYKPQFLMASPSTFSENSSLVWSSPTPILTGPLEMPEICMAANGVKGINSIANNLVKKVEKICNTSNSVKKVNLGPGRALLINNRKGLHARDSFQANYDGKDRWLLRSYIRQSIWGQRENKMGLSANVFY